MPPVLLPDEKGPWYGVPSSECVRLLTVLIRGAGENDPGVQSAVQQGRFNRGVGALNDQQALRLLYAADVALYREGGALNTADLCAFYAICIPPGVSLPHVVTLAFRVTHMPAVHT